MTAYNAKSDEGSALRRGLSLTSTGARGGRTTPDIVEILIRDLRNLVGVVESISGGRAPQAVPDLEDFDRFIGDAVVHLAVEAAIVAPVITHVLERDDLADSRRSDIHLLVRRMVQARDLGAVGRLTSRMRAIRVDLAEHAQITELGLLSHAYRVYDPAARRTLAERHPQASAEVRDVIRREGNTDLDGVARLDRDHIARLEGVASEALDVERLSSAPSTKAVPMSGAGRRRTQNGAAARFRTTGSPSPLDHLGDA